MTSNETPMNSESPEECSVCDQSSVDDCCGSPYCATHLEEHDQDFVIEELN